MMTHSTSHPPCARRLIASLALVTLLLQALAPAVAIALESHHDDAAAPHGSHHPGCPFDGKKNCPHHRAAAGQPSLVQCGDDDAVVSGTANATLRLLVIRPVQICPLSDASAISAATILPMPAWNTTTPETPPPRVQASL